MAVATASDVPANLLGYCKGCGKGIPLAYELPGVTKWHSALLSVPGNAQELHVQRPHPNFVYCRPCFQNADRPTAKAFRFKPATVELPPKDMAVAMLKAMSRKRQPMGSRKIARLAAIHYSATVLAILRKLRDAHKVTFEEGKWLLV